MTTNDWLIIAIFLFGITALIGIFRTKTAGFGRYSTSLLLLTLVLLVTALFLAAGKIESAVFANIAFAVAGFAGGLITGKHQSAPKLANNTDAAR
ncbi:MAG: hypothetical protein BroJett006_17330 [Betaproteobacteria bacterium]|nr:MAG: hypothetical protein BroJett006_17330 [Betaproteobacteria bacterium]